MDFYNIFLQAHKGFGYLVLLLVAVFLISLLVCMFGYSLITMILFHIQALVGITLLFIFSPGFKAALDGGTLMSDSYNRQTFVEHPFSMIIGAVLMTIINKKLKTNDKLNFGIVIMGVVAVILFAYAFPWMRVFGA